MSRSQENPTSASVRSRVLVTGMGVISSAGRNIEECRDSFASGICSLSLINDPALAHIRARYAGIVPDFNHSRENLPDEIQKADRHVALAYVAAREALAAARIEPADHGCRIGLLFSTCSGPMLLIEEHYERIIAGDLSLSQEEVLAKRYYSGAQTLARAFSIRGYCNTVVTACTAGTAAIALAADLIRCGMLDIALAGGSDAFSGSTLAGFDGLKATSGGKCAPFSKPFGLNLGEAAAFLCLESEASACARGVHSHVELLGSGLSNDAYHCSSPDPSGRGLALAIHRGLHDAALDPSQVNYINAHGTGTEANDKAETRAVRKAFGAVAESIPISSTKSMIGHCLGAAGAIEVIASVLCAERGVLPATVNFTEPREGCGLDYVPDPGRAWQSPRVFLSSNLAFGGHNAALLLSVRDRAGAATTHRSEPSVRIPSCAEEIWLTGMAVVSSTGVQSLSRDEFIAANREFQGVSIPGFGHVQAGIVDDALLEKYDRRLDLRHMDKSSRLATVAARAAIRDAAFPETASCLSELGLHLGLSAGPSWGESEFLTSFLKNHHQVSQVAAFPYIVPSSVAGNVCRVLRLTGHNVTLCGGPGAGVAGLVPALAALRNGHAEAILTGAVDELSERILADMAVSGGFCAGEPPGEGAVMLMLETARHARKRGAHPLAIIAALSFVSHTDSTHAITTALREANLRPDQIGRVCWDGAQRADISAAEAVCPSWRDRLIMAHHMGRLEASGGLISLSKAHREARNGGNGGRILCITDYPGGIQGCAILKLKQG